MQVVSWAELERIWVWGKKGEYISQGTSDVEEFLNLSMLVGDSNEGIRSYQSDAVNLHALLREL